ncbi:MAG: TlpA family protein disulfide reductase [Flavobacteriales bacterium]|nr:TlpA family protein disulfide reductase [Flavobacteriales bacterium]
MVKKSIFKSKEFYKNVAFLAFLAIILVPNPIGMEIKLLVSKLRVMVLNPSIESSENLVQLTKFDYEWQMSDINEEIVTLEDFKGKVILINHWATWCPPCIAEMPSFQKLYDDYGDKVVFIFITNDNKSKTDAFLKKKDLTLPVYQQVSKAPAKLFTNSLPTTFLVDQNGKILINETGASDWNSKSMREILDKLLIN